MFIHNPFAFLGGNADELRKQARILDSIAEGIVSAYAKKTGAGREQIMQWMDDETFFTAKDAVDVGLADKLEEPMEIAAKVDINAHFPKLNSRLINKQNGLSDQNIINKGVSDMDLTAALARIDELETQIQIQSKGHLKTLNEVTDRHDKEFAEKIKSINEDFNKK